MSMSLALGLPAKLSAVADALELRNRKDAAGERLMHQMSKPRRARHGEDSTGVHWFDDADRRQRLSDYCRQDVEVERELHDRLRPLSTAEQTIWVLIPPPNPLESRFLWTERVSVVGAVFFSCPV